MSIHANAMPCRINGRVYPSQKAAAADLGVRRNSISQAIRRGRTEQVGTGAHRFGNKNRGRKVEIFGLCFPSRKDAAAAFGVSRDAFSRAIRDGGPASMERLLGAAMMRGLPVKVRK